MIVCVLVLLRFVVGLFVIMMVGFLVSVWVSVMCCCLLLDSLLGWCCLCVVSFIVLSIVWVCLCCVCGVFYVK